MGKLASGMCLSVGKLMVVVPGPGAHRTAAGDEVLRREEVVNGGGTNQRWNETGKNTRRMRRSP
jgi:hypothetical protein